MKMYFVGHSLPKNMALVLVLIDGDFALARYFIETKNWHVQPFKRAWYKSRTLVTHWCNLNQEMIWGLVCSWDKVDIIIKE